MGCALASAAAGGSVAALAGSGSGVTSNIWRGSTTGAPVSSSSPSGGLLGASAFAAAALLVFFGGRPGPRLGGASVVPAPLLPAFAGSFAMAFVLPAALLAVAAAWACCRMESADGS
ncbi:hypothetical protein [Ralstonia pseudosolanacearum]